MARTPSTAASRGFLDALVRRFGRGSPIADLQGLAEALLSGRGEASGVALAGDILQGYADLDPEARLAFLALLEAKFGADAPRLERAIDAYRAEASPRNALALHVAAEPRRQELIRRLNLAPGGTAALVRMREDILRAMPEHPALEAVDTDFVHLLSSWFNRGFLTLMRIDWSTPAKVLEKIIRYEAVHAIASWDDLRLRLEPGDRRCFAFCHPTLADEPLIFVEVALTDRMPDAIAPLLAADRKPMPVKRANTAVFYSISNCQVGLRGVSFGNFLIKQVVEELSREFPSLRTFVTLSPVPGFAQWLKRERDGKSTAVLSAEDRTTLALLDQAGWHADAGAVRALRPVMLAAAAQYFLVARTGSGKPIDPVARFHLGNGARLERLNWPGDVSPKGLAQGAGLMVNYLYDLGSIERNHEAFANKGEVVAAHAVRRHLRAPARKEGETR
jgi:malonyl-CoA decarboxylase